MEIHSLKDFHRGWIIGNFNPSLLKVEGFEVGVLSHKKGEDWPRHVHKIATEYNVLLEGHLTIDGTIVKSGQIFIIYPGEITKAEFLEDCTILVIKVPSIPGDKYEIK